MQGQLMQGNSPRPPLQPPIDDGLAEGLAWLCLQSIQYRMVLDPSDWFAAEWREPSGSSVIHRKTPDGWLRYAIGLSAIPVSILFCPTNSCVDPISKRAFRP